MSEAGSSRFRVILLTTATTVCGLIPMMLSTSEQTQYPTAVSLAFGELFATVIILFLISVLMGIVYDIKYIFGQLCKFTAQ
ncbi:efflux RND transporter permease subunit [Deferribacteres bacterium DY0037]|uniref:efflux RND transporter permease subunit n=1 Tax=Denitrovibrio acetiphilus TaxID=118000 RepID=UPI00019B3B59